MTSKLLHLVTATLLIAQGMSAQTLYMPRTIKETYRNGTRSPDGKPGAKYWQNRGRYSITMTVMPPDRVVRGTEQITYINNSPDTLKSLVFKLFPNIHKAGAVRNAPVSNEYLSSGVTIDAFTVNGTKAPWPEQERPSTNSRVPLPTPLLPHDSVRMSVDWHYQISLKSNREGMIDSTTWYLAYFYPRVAVYDDYNGWDTMNFTDVQEFYSDFNDYDVRINVPTNYIVWGTGTLQTANTVLQPAIAQRFQASLTSDTTIRVVTKQDLAAHNVTMKGPNSWHFTATNIPDVAFNLSDHYNWDATSVVVDDATRRRASAQAAYNDTAADYHHVARYARHALDWLSHNWPGIPYPYEKSTVVQGFAGMEYPMMANDESYADTIFSRFVAEHEIAHTYMPFYMGINESRYAFMDEGFATFFEFHIGSADLGRERAVELFKQFRVAGWIGDPSPAEDLPIITPADNLTGAAYGNSAYGKAALGYLALEDMIGPELFKKALHEYMSRWNGKHPIPWDFFNTFNDVAGRNLNWFFDAWYFQPSYIDVGVKSVKGRVVELENIGGMPAPVDVKVEYADGTSETVHETSGIWSADHRKATVKLPGRKAIKSVVLEHGIWMDANPKDDSWSLHK